LWLVDATGEYISAADGSISVTGVHSNGLRCVTVLIGAYDLATGRPLFGCANQPFVHFDPQCKKYDVLCSVCDYVCSIAHIFCIYVCLRVYETEPAMGYNCSVRVGGICVENVCTFLNQM